MRVRIGSIRIDSSPSRFSIATEHITQESMTPALLSLRALPFVGRKAKLHITQARLDDGATLDIRETKSFPAERASAEIDILPEFPRASKRLQQAAYLRHQDANGLRRIVWETLRKTARRARCLEKPKIMALGRDVQARHISTVRPLFLPAPAVLRFARPSPSY